MSKKNHNIEQIRSFLASNVDVLLDYISTQRKSKLNNTDDLFDSFSADSDESHISWHSSFEKKNTLEVLLQEKESLGLYVSGNPLKHYKDIQEWVQSYTYLDQIHIVLVDKIKKIFTKSGNMMFALQISTSKGPMEGIIFPKNAMKFSTVLQEKQIFFIYGKESTKKRNRSKESDDGETQEYDELPKLLLDSITPFENGIIELINGLTKKPELAQSKQETLAQVDWEFILANPLQFTPSSIPSKSSRSEIPASIIEIKFPIQTPKTILSSFKQKLIKEPDQSCEQVQINIETSKGWKKAKKTFYIPKDILQSYSEYINS